MTLPQRVQPRRGAACVELGYSPWLVLEELDELRGRDTQRRRGGGGVVVARRQRVERLGEQCGEVVVPRVA